MAIFRSLTLQTGVWRQIQDANTLGVGGGIDTAAGVALTITAGTGASIALASDTTLAAGKNLTGIAGAGAVDFSALTGTFKTSTGVNTFSGSSHLFASSLDASTATSWNIGGTNATTINLGRTGQLVHILGNLEVAGTETVVGITAFQAQTTFQGPVTVGDGVGTDTLDFEPTSGRLGSSANPDVKWLKEVNHSFYVDVSTTANTAGANLSLASGAGVGTGGGGVLNLTGGASGAGIVGFGGGVNIIGGAGLATNGSGGAVTINGGAPNGGGSGGAVTIGNSNTAVVNIGRSGITTTVTGALSQLTGAVTLTANAASSFTTSAGALTVTAATKLNLNATASEVALDGATGITMKLSTVAYMDIGNTAANIVTIVKGLTQSGGPVSLTGNAASSFTTSVGNLSLDSAATLRLGRTSATAIEMGSSTAPTTVFGILDFDATNGRLGSSGKPDIQWTKELDHVFNVATTTTAATAGGALTILAGTGATTGAGGALVLRAGNAPGTGTGGDLTLDAGSSTSGNPGSISIGATNALAIGIGSTLITTTVTGGLTQLGGALSLTGTGASSVTTASGALTITGAAASTWSTAAGALTLTSAAAATWSTVAGALTIKGFAGINLQDTGGTIIDIGVTAANRITVAAGNVLQTTGTGNINLPNNASARFQIETVAVSANVTSANLGTLTAGPASNADALHTHSGGSATSVIQTGLTTTGNASGDGVYISGTNTVSGTIATAFASSKFVGVFEGTSGTIKTFGVVTPTFVGGAPSPGDQIFLSDVTAGAFTKTAPTTTGSYVAEVGIAFSATTFLIQVKPPVGPNP